ncbi:MAG: non-ribosomal peptide synthetase [Colwellia sp.]|nr:non-ribosomal peptide synthetase [Colwellia sp.]
MIKTIIHTVFEETVKNFPHNIAIKEGEIEITYSALNKRANRLAHKLRNNGVGRHKIVGLFLPAGIDYVVGLLSVAKSGGIFMPLDVEFPKMRIKTLLDKTDPVVIISNHDNTPPVHKNIINYSLNDDEDLNILDIEPDLISDPDDGNYIMFTSGSTGDPKAILGCHKGLSHFIHWEIKEFNLDNSVRISQLAPTTFDVSLRDIFTPLITGGVLCIPSQEQRTNPRLLLKWMDGMGLTLVHCVPSLFRLLLRELEIRDSTENVLHNLEHILLAGEAVYGNDVIRWRSLIKDRIELVNIYGPSETTLAKAFNRISENVNEPGRIIPIGKPISNTAFLIIKKKRLCKIGEIGEIYIKTPFRSKGYYKDPDATAACFVQNPLNTDNDDIIYKTGDSGRYLSDRSIEFLGRLDNQVKVHGIRVELGEIEKNILKNDLVSHAVVLAHKSKNDGNHLTCYYIEISPIEGEDLKEYLRDFLPEYMIPGFFVKMDKFPLNLHGKIDRKALPKPEDLLYQNIGYQEPEGEIETNLSNILGEIIGLKRVGVNNTFTELGGDSLSAIRTVSRIFQTFGVDIPFQDIFPNGTARTLANIISNTKHKKHKTGVVESATAEELAMLD